MKRLADFLAHHNSVPITLGFLFLAGGTALAASPSARDALIGGAVTETMSVDNAAITDVDLGRFDSNMTITNVTEDAQNYHVAYRYRTFGVEGAAWKEVSKDGVLAVARSALRGGDLKAYAIEQLRQVAESDLAYLKRAQAAEIASGRSESQTVTSYRGLAGLAIEMKDILLPPAPADSAPVTPAPNVAEQPSPVGSAVPVATTTASTTISSEAIATTPAPTREATTTDSVPAVPVATTTAARMQEPEAATTTAAVTPSATTTAVADSVSQ